MATTVVKTIGSGGDYSTPQAWEDAAPADLVVADQVWEGRMLAGNHISSATPILVMSGSTADATRFKRFTTAPGASFMDHANKATNALYPNSNNGVLLTNTGDSTVTAVAANESYCEVVGLQILVSGGLGGKCLNASSTATVKNTLCVSASYYTIATVNGRGINCLFVRTHSNTSQDVLAGADTTSLYNCTVATKSGASASGRSIRATYGHGIYKNLAVFANGSEASNGTGTVISCMTDRASPPTGYSTVPYADCFESSVEPYDFRIKAGSPLIGAGTVDATYAVTDVVGTTRGAAWDVGAWEYAPSGSPVASSTIAATIGNVTATGSSFVSPKSTIAATLSNLTFSGSAFSGASSSSILVTLGDVVFTGSSSSSGLVGTISTLPLFDLTTNTAKANQTGVIIAANHRTSGALVIQLTDQTTDASGVCTFTNAALVPGTSYRIYQEFTDGTIGCWPYTAV